MSVLFIVVLVVSAASPSSEWRTRCDGGDLYGCARYSFDSLRYDDVDTAERVARRSCDGGNMLGCVALGHALRRRTPPRVDEALALYAKACDSGESAGCLALANDRQDPASPRHDEEEALRLYERACSLKSAGGCAQAGARRHERKEFALAAALWDSACERGDELACGWLGEMLASGEGGTERNFTKAAPLLAKGCHTMMKSCNRFRDALDLPCKAGDKAACAAAKQLDRELSKLQQR